jgi:tetratricopeptide (TPR) repeat protein
VEDSAKTSSRTHAQVLPPRRRIRKSLRVSPSSVLLLLALLLKWPDNVGGKASRGKSSGPAIPGGEDASADQCQGLSRGEQANFDRLLQRAAQLSQTRALDSAQACLESALRLASTAPKKAHVLFNLAVIARQRGDVDGAKEILLQAPAEGVRDWAQAHMILKSAVCVSAYGQSRRAMTCENVLQAHMFLGILQLESGESRKALKSLARAKKLSPQDPAIYRDMAQAYYNLGEAPTAVHVWEEVRGRERERESERASKRERERRERARERARAREREREKERDRREGGRARARERPKERERGRERVSEAESIYTYIGHRQHADEQRRLFQPGAPAARAGGQQRRAMLHRRRAPVAQQRAVSLQLRQPVVRP